MYLFTSEKAAACICGVYCPPTVGAVITDSLEIDGTQLGTVADAESINFL
jgi:hypothetical protein